jgi:RNA polymerase sigma-70 factor (ECF subfamily)
MWVRPRRRVGSFRPRPTRSIIGPRRQWDWASAHATCLREARRVLGSSPDAEDAAQEAALRAWRFSGACRERRQAWLARIAFREALRIAEARRPVPLDELPEPAAPSHEPAVLDRIDVRRALARLAPPDRALLYARYWRDSTQDQAAALLGLPEGTAKVRLHRLRAQLRRTLSDR